MSSKTIFIVVTRGHMIREFLRSGFLNLLKNNNFKIVILVMSRKDNHIPSYLKEEFEDEKVILRAINEPKITKFFGRVYRKLCELAALLVYSKTTRMYLRVGNIKNVEKTSARVYLASLIFSFLGKFTFLKKLVRFIDSKLSTDGGSMHAHLFDEYKPDLVFSTSVISKVDISVMKEARRRGIKTISVTKGWDHLAKRLLIFVPDKLVLQNEVLREEAINFQKISPQKLAVCGFPRFDWYSRKDILLPRENFFKLLGFDPRKRLIFFGSSGAFVPQDNKIVEHLIDFIKQGKLVKDCCVLARPHFSDLKQDRLDVFKGIPFVKVDDNFTRSDFFIDTWDPSVEETKIFVNSIYHSDIVIMIASTLVLDACCMDRPVIGAAFDGLFSQRTGEDLTSYFYLTNHYSHVVATGAMDLVRNEQELLTNINNYLIHPEYKRKERKILLDKLCYKIDGQSSYRVSQVVMGELYGDVHKV